MGDFSDWGCDNVLEFSEYDFEVSADINSFEYIHGDIIDVDADYTVEQDSYDRGYDVIIGLDVLKSLYSDAQQTKDTYTLDEVQSAIQAELDKVLVLKVHNDLPSIQTRSGLIELILDRLL